MTFWQPVTGGVETGDISIEAAARRELFEETSFDPLDRIRLDYRNYFPIPDALRHHFDEDTLLLSENPFLATIAEDATLVIDPSEHDDFRWCSYLEARDLLFWAGNRQALTECYRRLGE
jgi:8-oxo-dGTP pyrophosphatase MutT (NUDIX family)